MEEIKQKKGRLKGSYPLLLLILVMAVIAAVAFYGVYRITMDIIVNSNIENMKELAEHDKLSVQTSIDDKELMVYHWAYAARARKLDSINELLEEIGNGNNIIGSDTLYLVDEDLDFYSSNGAIQKKEYYEDLFDGFDGETSFIIRYDTYEYAHFAESRKEFLAIFTQIKEFSVEGKTFLYAVAELPLKTFQGELKIDSYDGLGFSNIIDREGNYVINVDSKSLQARDNFFDRYQDAKLKEYESMDAFIDAVHRDRDKDSLVTRVSQDGTEYIIVASMMEGENWTFVTLCETSAFSSLGNHITAVFAAMVAVMMITVSLVVALAIGNRTARIKVEVEKQHKLELADALAQAQAANKAKTTFLNSISHDIRTPMNAIIGFTSLAVVHVNDTEAVKGYLAKISKASDHLLSLINDVLDMSRIESGKVNIHEQEENLPELLHSLHDIVQADVNAKHMDFCIDTDISDEEIICDKLRVNQVLLNIVSNSLKYTEPGGTISIRVRQRAVKPSGYATYEFRIKDNGIGMTQEFVKTIFDPFTRAETSGASGIQGTGLGMTITRNIVEMMGGKISVESRLHEGTEFVVSLDFKLAAGRNMAKETEETDGLRSLAVESTSDACGNAVGNGASAQETVDFTGKRILLVEDNELNREIATEILEGSGFEIEAAENGQVCCDMLSSSEPGYYDVVLMDVQMPVMDGYAATQAIRKFANQQLANIPIIAMTANAFREDRQNAAEAGMNGHIAKPIDIPVLFATLEGIFRKGV